MAEKLDEHIKDTLQARYVLVKERLEEYRGCIERVVAKLTEYETIDGIQLREVIEAFEVEFNIPSKLKASLVRHESVNSEEQPKTDA